MQVLEARAKRKLTGNFDMNQAVPDGIADKIVRVRI